MQACSSRSSNPIRKMTRGVLHESIIRLEIDRQTEPGVLKALHDCHHRPGQVRAAVEDWPGHAR